jgi:dihydropteroate synthase
VDTCKPEVAGRALALGAHMLNDIAGLRDPAMIETVASHGAAVVIMHMKGEPKTMQQMAEYEDVAAEVKMFLGRADGSRGRMRGAFGFARRLAGVAEAALGRDT